MEEGEAGTVHDPQVLQGEQIIFQQYPLSSSPNVQRIHHYFNGLE